MSKISGIDVVRKSTGEVVTFHCGDEDQLMNAVRETSEDINRSMLHANKSRHTKFIMVNQDLLCDTELDNQLKGADRRILFKILGCTDYGNRILIKQLEIAESLKMDKSTVSRSFKNLVDFGFITQNLKTGEYSISRKFALKGKRGLSSKRKQSNARETSSGYALKVINGGRE